MTDHVVKTIRAALESASESTSRRIDDEERMILACDIDRALASLSALQEERERMRAALKALVAKLDLVHADEGYKSVWSLHMIHGGAYTGPQYDKELEAARAAMEPAPKEGRS